MTPVKAKIVVKARHGKGKHAVLRPRTPPSRRHCTGAGIVDTSGRWQLRLEDY